MSNLSLTLRLRADADGLVKVLDASGKEVAEFGREGERAGKRADAGFTQARRGVQSISEQLKIARRQLLGFIGVQFGAQLGRQLIGIADQYTNLNSRIGLVTNSQREANETFDALFEVAQRSRAELGATVDLYTTLARSTADLRLSQTDLLQITETINQSFIISGASAEASRNAIIQLSQGLAAGALRGDEFNSVAEQAPILMDLLARSLNMARGELREFAAQGGITSEVLTGALLQGATDVQRQFEGMQLTIAQASQQLGNAISRLIGEGADVSHVADLLADAIGGLAKNLDTAVDLIGAAMIVAIGRYVGASQAAQAVTLANVRALLAQRGALNAVNVSLLAATASTKGLALAGRGLLTLLGGPVGLLISGALLATLFGGDLLRALNSSRRAMEALTRPTDEARAAVERAARALQLPDAAESIRSVTAEMKVLKAEASQVEQALLRARIARTQNTISGTSSRSETALESDLEDRIEVLTEQIRLLQQLSGEAQFEDIELFIRAWGAASDFAIPLLDRLGQAIRGPVAATEEFATAMDGPLEKLREQVITLTSGEQAWQDYQDAILLAAAAEQDAKDKTTANTAAVRQAIAEREALGAAVDAVETRQKEATEAAKAEKAAIDALVATGASLRRELDPLGAEIRELARQLDLARELSGRSDAELAALGVTSQELAALIALLTDRMAELGQRGALEAADALAAFRLETEQLEATLAGAAAVAEFDFRQGVLAARDALIEGTIGPEEFERRLAALSEQLNRSLEDMDALRNAATEVAQGFASAILQGGSITESLGRSLSATGGRRITEQVGKIFADGINKGIEGLDLSEEARSQLGDIGSSISLAAGQALQGQTEQAIGTAVGAIAGSFIPGIGTALGASIGGFLGGLFGGGGTPKFQVSGANTRDSRDIGPAGQDELQTRLGAFFLGLRALDAETEDAVSNALVGFAATIAGVVRDTDLISAIADEIANTRFSSRSDGESLERLFAEVFDNVLNALDSGIAAFVRRGSTLEEELARFEAAFAISRRLVGRRGLGIDGSGLVEPSPAPGPVLPPGGGDGGGIVLPPGDNPPQAPRVDAGELGTFNAIIQGLGDAAALTNPALIATLELVEELQIGNESLVQTFDRLVATTNLLDNALQLTGASIGDSRADLVRFGSDLVAFFGDSPQALAQQLDRVLGRVFSDEERFTQAGDAARQRLADLLGDLGIQFTDELATQEGFGELFRSLFGTLSPEDTAILIEAGVALDALLDAEEALAAARGESAEAIRDEVAIAQILADLELDATRAALEGVDLALFDVGQQFDALRDELIALGATEEELIRLAQLRAEAEQRAVDAEAERLAQIEAQRVADIATIFEGLDLDAARAALEGVDLALFDVGQQFDALRDELIALGATEEELIRLAQLRAEAEQRVVDIERERAARELADLMEGVETAIFELTRSEFRVALRELGADMAELRARAIELGASEEQLGRIRQLEILRQNAILADAQARLVDLAATFLGNSDQAAAAETSRINDIRERMEDRYRREVAALERIGELVDSLLLSSLSPLTPREQEAEARRQLNAAFAAAEAGDVDALEALPGLVQQFLQILQTNTGGVGAFPAEFQAVLDRLASIEADGPQTRPPSQRPPTAADVDSAAGSITAGLEALERAQLASQIIDIMGFVAQRTGETPSEIADRLGLPLDELIEAVSGELPEATGEALRSFFDELVLEADRQLSELVGIQETLSADADVQERISNLTKDSLAELRKITALLEAAAIAPGFIPEQPGPTSIPGFADGGFASGLIMTGERGRELVLPNPVTEFFVRNGIPIQPSSGVADRQLVEEIRGLRADIQAGNVERSRQSTILQVGNRNLAAAINSAKSERDRNRFIGQPSRGGSTCGSI